MDIVVEYFKFLYKIVWYIYMKLLEFYGLRKIILVVNITRLSIYFIWCDLLYFFLYAVMYQDEFKLYTTFWTNMHAYFFFENGLQHAYIVSLQPMKHIYTAYIRIFFITFFWRYNIHTYWIGSEGLIHVRFPICHPTCKLTKGKCSPCAHHVCMLLYYNKNIINWLTMNTKYCIWVMFGIYRKYQNNNSSNWLTMYC